MKDIDGKEQDLVQYYGNVVLMVNVASRCGLTPQYEQLEAVYRKYAERGFVILAFPANNFLGQEPESNDKIKQFCTSKYSVTFPMFAKVSVKGNDICDLYKYLTAMKAGHEYGGEIEWNFGKFLIGRNGQIVDRFSPRTKPDAEKVIEAIEKALAAPVPEDSPLTKKMKEAAEKKKDAEEKSDRESRERSSDAKKQ
ncbi:MAG: glutathione peroxidase [Phycisphaerae bacterium]|nr:glutathione peroxidase [Phycisphaerae bacterium]